MAFKLAALTAKVKIWIAAGLVVLIGGAGAAFAVYQSPDVVVGQAFGSLFSESNPSYVIDADLQSVMASGSASLEVDTASEGNLLSLQANVNVQGTPIGATLNLLSAKSGDAYLSLSDFDTLAAYLAAAGLVPVTTIDNAKSALTDTWVKFSKTEIDAYTAGNSCLSGKLSNGDYAKKVSADFASVLRSNFFFVSKKELAQEGSDRVFQLNIDAAKLRSFLTSLIASKYYPEISECIPQFKVTAEDIATIKQADIDASLKNAEIRLYADSFSHKLSKLNFVVNDAETTQKITFSLKTNGDQSAKVVIPTKVIPSTELLTVLLGGSIN